MSDFKSKLPDLKELGEMTKKLYKDISNSVKEIIGTYKQRHPKNKDEAKVDIRNDVSADKKPAKEAESTETDKDNKS